jgi:hypothetical protein
MNLIQVILFYLALMKEDDLIRVVKMRGGSEVTVKEIVSDLKSWFIQNAEKNKQRMKVLMKRCLEQEKSKAFSLKKEYSEWIDPKALKQ